MMSFAFGNFAGLVDKVQPLFEIGETKDAVKMVAFRRLPARNFREKSLHTPGVETRHPTFARYAVPFG
jgi:hypothetical protein